MHPQQQIEAILALWQGRFDNSRQVAATLARGGAPAPELTRERRRLEVQRLEAPQLGAVVLYLQEFRASRPEVAQRQRVLTLVWDGAAGAVRAEQWFFAEGPTYDRPPRAPAAVAELAPEAFQRHPGCDLFFTHEPELDRWRGAMRPGACTYCHPGDGEVAAEYEMLLRAGELWYRDRSLRLADGRVRGEIDGFSWLLFDRLGPDAVEPSPPPALVRQQGVWQGTFQRYDADGVLQDRFASTVVVRIEEGCGGARYHQSNHYRWPDGSQQTIDSHGEIREGRIWVRNGQFEGWAVDVPAAAGGGGGAAGDGDTVGVLRLWSREPGGPQMLELIHVSADGRRRHRVTQTLRDGQLVRRTLIDEVRIHDDWRAWDAAQRPDG
ncbi:MAG: CpcT/CpeT family chromophore lyase [Synechococcaceae cyanobacterium]